MRRALALATQAMGCDLQRFALACSDRGGPGYFLRTERGRFSGGSAGCV
jgi:hypothetical protein